MGFRLKTQYYIKTSENICLSLIPLSSCICKTLHTSMAIHSRSRSHYSSKLGGIGILKNSLYFYDLLIILFKNIKSMIATNNAQIKFFSIHFKVAYEPISCGYIIPSSISKGFCECSEKSIVPIEKL